MAHHARAERDALCATLIRVGPDAPTLCEGWAARDLAAHLVLRDRRPDAQAGMLLPPLAQRTERMRRRLADGDWSDLVAQIRSGPPFWHPARIAPVDEALNAAEFFVHHEDVRRAQEEWAVRDLGDDLQGALWRSCRTTGRLTTRHASVGIELVAPGQRRVVTRRGHPMVRIEGQPAEILLFLFGRRQVAQVHLDGPDAAVQELSRGPLGI